MNRAILRIIPNLFSFISVFVAGVTAATVPHWWSVIFLVFSLYLGGNGGRLANRQNRTSRMSLAVGAVSDRISEIFWAIAFYRIGAPLAWVLAFAALAAFQEYAKVRLASAMMQHVAFNTVAERPTRAGFLFIAILTYQITVSHAWMMALAAGLTLLQAVSFLLLLRFAYKQLH